jgi:phospholipase C
MKGFLYSGNEAAKSANVPAQGPRVMECFQPDQLPVMTALAQEFALFNFWYSSLPGPTWPNRFFVHAATSGGLTDSPGKLQIIAGFSFQNGTVYEAIADAGKDWRIYHDGLPQTAGIDSLRLAYVDPFTRHYREMKYFAQDVQDGILPDYTFIEPNYDTGENYENGNSMHPLNDVRKGEALVKSVYELLRNSNYWQDTMLIITFDEHGGFYDHVSPPPTVPTGDDTKYSNPQHLFAFNRLGIRVPAIVISAYTQKGIIIGNSAADPSTVFDHSSIVATVTKRFSLTNLTARSAAANTLEPTVSLDNPRTDAPTTLPTP